MSKPIVSEMSGTPSREPAVAVRWVLASLSLSMVQASLGTSIANVGLPTLAQAFNASFQYVQWVVLAYLLAVTTLIVSVGRLGDIVGRRRLLLAGIALFLAASVLCGFAPTLPVLIAARVVQGLGAAVMMAPLVRLAMFRDPVLSAGLVMSAVVSAVMMTTLVIGPFYLSRGLLLGAAKVGLVMSFGPFISALTGVPAGQVADRFGPQRMTFLGLGGVAVGCLMLSLAPAAFGVYGYILPIVVTTVGYAVFQTANNTTVMADVRPEQRGVVSGMLSLSRNLGLITGASVMGAVFALAAGVTDMAMARPESVSAGMRVTFAVSAGFVVVVLGVVRGIYAGRRLETGAVR
jgi:MFS family permease